MCHVSANKISICVTVNKIYIKVKEIKKLKKKKFNPKK